VKNTVYQYGSPAVEEEDQWDGIKALMEEYDG
jgi:hypothetical protein